MKSRLMFALLLVAIGGPNQRATAATPVSAAKQPKTLTLSRAPADAQIEREIKNKLAKSKMNREHFTVSVVKGAATLEGTTNVMQHKGAMTRMAKSSGATSVHNNIRISDAAKNKAIASLQRGRSSPSQSVPMASRPVPRMTARGAALSASGNTAAAPSSLPRATVLPPQH